MVFKFPLVGREKHVVLEMVQISRVLSAGPLVNSADATATVGGLIGSAHETGDKVPIRV